MGTAASRLALLLAREGDKEQALELAMLVERYPAAAPTVQERARQLAAELSHQISEAAFQHIQRRSRARTLEDMLAESAHLPPSVNPIR